MVKKLSLSIREFKKDTILTPIFVLFEVILECIIPLIMASLIDHIYDNSLSVIVKYGIILFIMAVVSLLMGALSGKHCAIASAGFARNLRSDLFKKVNDFSFENVDKFQTSSLVTRLTTDVTNVQMAYMMIIRTAVRCPFMLVFAFIMAGTISWKMAILFAIVVPLMGLGLFLIIRFAMPYFRKIFKRYDALNESVQENIKGMRVVKSYVREDFEKEKFNLAATNVCKDFTKADRVLALNAPMMQAAIYICMTAISIVGSIIIVKTFKGISPDGTYLWGELSTGQLSSLITYSFQVLMSLMMVSMIFVMIALSVESARRIIEVLDEVPTQKSAENPVTEVKDGSIVFDHVSFKYDINAQKNALNDINLTIPSGSTVGIIGGTGSSKTSLVNLIGRMYDPTEGTLFVGGENILNYDVKKLRENVAVVLQKNILFSGTIEENVRFGNKTASLEDVKEACRLAQAAEFIDSLPDNYQYHIEQGGSNVSGGQKQRLCIARALLRKPKILILDDSTSAVDTKTDALIRNAFKSYIPDTTKVIIAQRVSSIQDADIIVVLDNGEIKAVGNHESLLKTSSIYQEVFYSQNRGGEKDA